MSNLNSPVSEIKSPNPTNEANASFLRAARAGNLDKVLEYLKENIDINVSNSNGLNALHLASKEGHVHVVEELLKQNADVNAATKKGNTALHIASLAGQQAVVELLVQHEANVDCRSQNGFTPLYMAAQENHLEVVRFLLANNANQSLATEDGFTPLAVALQQGHEKVVALLLENDSRGKIRLPALHIAAKKNDVKAAALLLNNDPNMDLSPEARMVNCTTKSGFTPLHIAAHYGNAEIAKFLISKGSNVNYEARQSITPLHVATKWGKANSVNLLLDNGAKIDVKTRDGLTPLHCAARSGHDQVVELLISRGAPINAKTKNGLTALHMAAQGDHVEAARILLYHSPKLVDQTTCDFLTALHVAAHCGHVKIAKLLIDHKADVNSRALNGFTPLHIACKKNRIKVIELLIKHGASKEATTESGLTPLHVASFMGCMNVVVFLIQHGSLPNVPTIRGETPLHLAARANQTDIVRILLRHGASVDAKAKEQQTPLHIATRLGNTDIIALLLRHGAFVDAPTSDGYTPLHIASKEGQEEVASILFENGASLNVTTRKGFTPLHIASKYGNIKVASLLLQRDAQPDIQGKNGLTPLHVATHYNRPSVAHLLLQHNASPHIVAKNGYSALHIAAKKNQMDIATTLLEYNAKTNCESNAGFTPLHLACQEGHLDMASLLLDHEAQPGAASKNGLTPLHLCAQEDKVNCAAVLVKMGASIDPQTKAGYTPLHVACHFGQINMVKFLLGHQADVNIITKHGFTSLHCAAQQGHVLIVKLLLEHGASPDITNNNGQTPLAIAQRLGYISVIEELRQVTQTTLVSTTIKTTEEKYKVQTPETMQETFMSDSEDEMGDDAMFGDAEHYKYLTNEADLNNAADDSIALTPKTSKRDDNKQPSPQSPTFTPESPLVAQQEENLLNGHDNQPESPKQQVNNNKLLGTSLGNMSMAESMDGSFYNGYASSKNVNLLNETDNIPVESKPKSAGFLISFMVDARGGAMKGCRHSGVRVIIPPKRASMPTRITCRFVRKEKLALAPPLNEGESLAARVLEMGPQGYKFLAPVVLEIPHYASMRGREREIVILRSDSGEKWYEHPITASESAVEEALGCTLELLSSQNPDADATSQHNQDDNVSQISTNTRMRITRIITNDFPKYFALVSRVRHETHAVSETGGVISSTIVPKAQAVFPEKALQKKIKLSLQAMPIPYELVTKMFGNRVVVSPIVTIEPRRRKFHKAITLTIPLPKSPYKGMINNYVHNNDSYSLRLLCSITGGLAPAQWEDITGHTPLSYIDECVSFTTTVSARFWLMDCQNVAEATKMATELYREAIAVPFMARFIVYAKRHDVNESKLRVYCITDDKEEKPLEQREGFVTVAKSKEVEVLDNRVQWLEMGGNIAPVSVNKSTTNSIAGHSEQLNMTFMSFYENRLPFTIRIKDLDQNPPCGRLVFLKDSKSALAKLDGAIRSPPVCTLDIQLPPYNKEKIESDEIKKRTTLERGQFNLKTFLNDSSATLLSQASSTRFNNGVEFNLRLLANDLSNSIENFDWINLAKLLNLTEQDIEILKHSSSNSPNLLSASLANQTHDMLVYFANKYNKQQQGNLEQVSYGQILMKALLQMAVDQDIIDRNSYLISNLPLSSENIYSVEKSLNNKLSDLHLKEDVKSTSSSLDQLKQSYNIVNHEDRDYIKESESAEASENENEQYALRKLPMNDQIEIANVINQIDHQISNLHQNENNDQLISTTIIGEEHYIKKENGFVTKTILDAVVQGANENQIDTYNQHQELTINQTEQNEESFNEASRNVPPMDYASKINAEYEAIKRNILSRTGENEILTKTPVIIKSTKKLDTVIDSQLACLIPPLNQVSNLNSSYYDNLDHADSDLQNPIKYAPSIFEYEENDLANDTEVNSSMNKSTTSELLNDIIQQVLITEDQTEKLNKLDNEEFTWENLILGYKSSLKSDCDDGILKSQEPTENPTINEQIEEVEQVTYQNETNVEFDENQLDDQHDIFYNNKNNDDINYTIKLDRTQLREFEFNTDEFGPAVAAIQNIEQQSPIIERELVNTGKELENLRQRLAMTESVSAVTQDVIDEIRKEYNITDRLENEFSEKEDEYESNKNVPNIGQVVQDVIKNLAKESRSDLEKIIMIEPICDEVNDNYDNNYDSEDDELEEIIINNEENDIYDENRLIESSSSASSSINIKTESKSENQDTYQDREFSLDEKVIKHENIEEDNVQKELELNQTKQYHTFDSCSSTDSEINKDYQAESSKNQDESSTLKQLIPTINYLPESTTSENFVNEQEYLNQTNLIINIVKESDSREYLLDHDHLQRDESSYCLSSQLNQQTLLMSTHDSIDDISAATTVIEKNQKPIENQMRRESSADISSEAYETNDDYNLDTQGLSEFLLKNHQPDVTQYKKSDLFLDIKQEINNSESTEPLIYQAQNQENMSNSSLSINSSSNYSLTTSDEHIHQKHLVDEENLINSCSSLNSDTQSNKLKNISKSLNFLESLVVPTFVEPYEYQNEEYTIQLEKREEVSENRQIECGVKSSKLESPIKTSQSLNFDSKRPVSFNPPRPNEIDLFPSSLMDDEYSKCVNDLEQQTPTPVENIVGSFFDKRVTSSNEPSIDLLAQSNFDSNQKDIEDSVRLDYTVDDGVVDRLIDQIADPENPEAEVSVALATAFLFSSNVNSSSDDQIKSRNESLISNSSGNEEQTEIRDATPSEYTRYIVVSDETFRSSELDNQAFINEDDEQENEIFENSSCSSRESIIINSEYDDTADQQMMKIKIIQSSLPSKSLINTNFENEDNLIENDLLSTQSIDENINDLQTVQSLYDYDQKFLNEEEIVNSPSKEFFIIESNEIINSDNEEILKSLNSIETAKDNDLNYVSQENISTNIKDEETDESKFRYEEEEEENLSQYRVIDDKEPLITDDNEEDDELIELKQDDLIQKYDVEKDVIVVTSKSNDSIQFKDYSDSSFEQEPLRNVKIDHIEELEQLITKDGVLLDDQSFLICTPNRSNDQTPQNEIDDPSYDDNHKIAKIIVEQTLNISIEKAYKEQNDDNINQIQINENFEQQPSNYNIQSVDLNDQANKIISEKDSLERKEDLINQEYTFAEMIVEKALQKSIEILNQEDSFTQNEFKMSQNDENILEILNKYTLEKNSVQHDDTEPLIQQDFVMDQEQSDQTLDVEISQLQINNNQIDVDDKLEAKVNDNYESSHLEENCLHKEELYLEEQNSAEAQILPQSLFKEQIFENLNELHLDDKVSTSSIQQANQYDLLILEQGFNSNTSEKLTCIEESTEENLEELLAIKIENVSLEHQDSEDVNIQIAKSLVSKTLSKSLEYLNSERKNQSGLIQPMLLFELCATEPNSDQEFDPHELLSNDEIFQQNEKDHEDSSKKIISSNFYNSNEKSELDDESVEKIIPESSSNSSIIRNRSDGDVVSALNAKEVRFNTQNETEKKILVSLDFASSETQSEQLIEFSNLQKIILNCNYENTFNQMNKVLDKKLSENSDSIEFYHELEKIVEDKLEDESLNEAQTNDEIILNEAKSIINRVIENAIQALTINSDGEQRVFQISQSESDSFEENLKSVDEKIKQTENFCNVFELPKKNEELVEEKIHSSRKNICEDFVDIQNRIESTLESTDKLENYLNKHLDNILDEISSEQMKIDENLNKELDLIKSQSSELVSFSEDDFLNNMNKPLLTSSFMSDTLPSDSETDQASFHTAATGLNESKQNVSSSNYLTARDDQDPSTQQLSASESFYSAQSKLKSLNSSILSSYSGANNSYNNLDESYSTLNDTTNNNCSDFDRTFVSESHEVNKQELDEPNQEKSENLTNQNKIDSLQIELDNQKINNIEQIDREENTDLKEKSMSSSSSSLASDKLRSASPNTHSTNTNSSSSPLLLISKQINSGSGDNVSCTSSILEFEKLEAQYMMELNDDSNSSLMSEQKSDDLKEDSFSYFEPSVLLTNDLNTIYEINEKESSSSSSPLDKSEPKLETSTQLFDLSIDLKSNLKSKVQSASASNSPVQSPTGKQRNIDHKGSTCSLTKQVLQLQQLSNSRSSSSSSVRSTDSFETEFKTKVKIDENSFFAKVRKTPPPLIETTNENTESSQNDEILQSSTLNRKKSQNSSQPGSKRPSRTSSSASSTSSTSIHCENSTKSTITVINAAISVSNLKQSKLSAEDLPSFKKNSTKESSSSSSKVPNSISASNIMTDLPKSSLNQNLSQSANLSKENEEIPRSSHSHHSSDCYCGKSSPSLSNRANSNSDTTNINTSCYNNTTQMAESNFFENQSNSTKSSDSPSSQ
ncbi:unnamed protein product [Brachionus calyciflorus]|uniref:ZU5 domain-containing protein n=1 Tax=Brachionus calyciflorus TaxID=104777 RepID=A0A813MTM0_9BILA|nr:unnamed protein product [Brachionus calyciflorus]